MFRISELKPVFSRITRQTRLVCLYSVTCAVLVTLVSVSLAVSKDETVNNGRAERSGYSGKIDIENFGKVTDFFYRGAQPQADEYSELAGLGIKTIVDLRDDPRDYARKYTERNGMRYINMPMDDKSYPEPNAAPGFLEIVNNRANWPVFVHCAGGRHRTGVMTAVYRMTMQGWNIDRAYEEMKDYDFYTRWGHKAMKKYVYDYYEDLNSKRGILSVATK